MPGLTGVTGILSSVVEPVPTLTVTEVAPKGSSAGTWITMYSWPPVLQTANIGANCRKLPATNSTLTSDNCSGRGPRTRFPDTQPCRPVARPRPVMVSTAVGLTPPGCPPAPLKKLELVTCGPGRRIVSVNCTENELTEAVTTAGLGVGPPCKNTEGRPWAGLGAPAPFGNGSRPPHWKCTSATAPAAWP